MRAHMHVRARDKVRERPKRALSACQNQTKTDRGLGWETQFLDYAKMYKKQGKGTGCGKAEVAGMVRKRREAIYIGVMGQGREDG